jgi:ribosomal protein L2
MKRIILFLCVLVFSIFSNTNNLLAKEIGNNIKDNISNEIEEIEHDNNKKTNISNSSSEDIFGDEQTFPFVAGLGKNAAH